MRKVREIGDTVVQREIFHVFGAVVREGLGGIKI